MIFLAVSGVLSVIFIFVMFRLKSVYGATVAMTAVLAVSFVQMTRFVFKDGKLALMYLPVFVFNAFCTVLMFSLAALN